eukprot:5992065-Pleurochrysis_carterae.AAC.2
MAARIADNAGTFLRMGDDQFDDLEWTNDAWDEPLDESEWTNGAGGGLGGGLVGGLLSGLRGGLGQNQLR